MFVDEAKIWVKAGDGGNGCLSFHREKYVPKGGPDGGNGGRGGSVYFLAADDVDTLLDFVGKHHWQAQNGHPGMGKNMYGADGKDLVIKVPAGHAHIRHGFRPASQGPEQSWDEGLYLPRRQRRQGQQGLRNIDEPGTAADGSGQARSGTKFKA